MRCVEKDECGNETEELNYAHHYKETQKRLDDTVEEWTEMQFGDADIPYYKAKK